MDYSTAKADAEKDGTEKAERTKKVIKRVVQVGGALVGLVLFTIGLHQFMDWEHSKSSGDTSTGASSLEIPMAANLKVEDWPKELVPAGGVSGHLSTPIGLHLVVPGSGFEIHQVYASGEECVVNSTLNPCPSKADVAYTYLKDVSNMTQWVSYAYANGKA